MASLVSHPDEVRVVSKRFGQGATNIDRYLELDGYKAVQKALGMQILAGHGFATESLMSFRYRESIVAPISGGTSQIQRNAIARSMGLRGY